MISFVDGIFTAVTAGSIYWAVKSHHRLAAIQQALASCKAAVNKEAATLEAWIKHLDEEAKVDYTSLIGRLKNL